MILQCRGFAFVHRVCAPPCGRAERMSPPWRSLTNGSGLLGRSAMAKHRKRASPPLKVLIGTDTEYQFNPTTKRNDVLSYQGFLINPDTGLEQPFIHHVQSTYRGKYPRLPLAEFLVRVLLKALKNKVIGSPPRMITMACHFARADLCMFADYHSFLKRRLAAVRGTMVTTTRFLTLDLPFPDGKRRVTVSIIDTSLLAPPGSPLADLGAHIGLPKLEILPGYSIAEMARYRDEQPEAFDAYALQDAEIAARYASQVSNLFQELGIPGRAPTLGSAGVALFKRLLPKKDLLAFLGLDTGSNSGKRRHWKPASYVAALMQFTAGCFHGGMNTIFRVGYSPN